MLKQPSNRSISPSTIDLHLLHQNVNVKEDILQDKLCSSTSGESSIEDFLISEEEEFFMEIAKDQHKVTSYISEKDIAFSSRENILTWASKLLNAVSLTNKQKQSIFHRFASAYDLLNEKLFIELQPIQEDKPFKRIIVALFLISYKLEGYTIGKITIKSLIDAFFKGMNIRETDIRRSEIRILKIFNYNCVSFENNMHNLGLILSEMIKKKYNLTKELGSLMESKLSKMNKIIQCSDDIVFDVYPIDKAAISVYALILYLKQRHEKNNNGNEQYTYQLIYYEMALLINDLYSYLNTVLKVITIPQNDFKHYSFIYAEMMEK